MAKSATAPAPATASASSQRIIGLVRLIGRVRELSLVVVLLLVIGIVGSQQPRFFAPSTLVSILLSVAIITVVAVGETLVVLTRNVDLSVGSIVGLTAFYCANLFKQSHNFSIPLAVLIGCGIGLGLGVLNGLLVAYGKVPAIVATLGTLYIYRGIDFAYAKGKQVSAIDVPDGWLNIAAARIFGIPLLIIIALALVALATWALRYTRIGRQVYAIGSNPDAAQVTGIYVSRIVLGMYALSGLLSGLAGVLWASQYAAIDSRAASGLELLIVAAVVVGGVNINGGSGTVIGTLLGAIILGTLQSGLIFLKISPFWLQAFYGAAILLAVLSDALLNRRIQRAFTERKLR